MTNSHNDRIVFVPGCLLCSVYMAKKNDSRELWRYNLLRYLNENDYSIVQLPCPESFYKASNCGINRKPHGIKYYESLPGFNEYCAELAAKVVNQIEDFVYNGYSISAILGIEHSPTCAASYMYTNHGTQKKQGIFIKHLADTLEGQNISVPIVGINRRFINKTICNLEDIKKMGS